MFKEIVIDINGNALQGYLAHGENSRGWIIFAHGSGSSRKSPRNNWVARELNHLGFSTLLFDLLTIHEDKIHSNRFNIPLLAQRLLGTTEWLLKSPEYQGTPIGYFGASTGAAAALMAAAEADRSWPLYAIVCRGGRPDLAERDFLQHVLQPTLLIVGSNDVEVIKLNEKAKIDLPNAKLVLIPGASHLFEEPGAFDEVAKLTGDWFLSHLDTLDKNYQHA